MDQTIYAPWPSRAVALLIDAVPVLALGSLFLLLAGASYPFPWEQFGNRLSAGEHGLRVAMFFLATLVYFPLIMKRTNGQTLGKMATGIRVVRTDGQPMTVGRAAWREAVVKDAVFNALGLIPVLGALIGLADYLTPLPDKQNRAIHDALSATRVIKTTVEEDGQHLPL